jgi:hypothetical protein
VPENDETSGVTSHLDLNWRTVWIWSAVISAPIAVLISFAVLGDPTSRGPVLHSFREYAILWAFFTALLTPTGVLGVFRATFDPAAELAKRQRERNTPSENSRMAVATKQILTWIAAALGKGGPKTRS